MERSKGKIEVDPLHPEYVIFRGKDGFTCFRINCKTEDFAKVILCRYAAFEPDGLVGEMRQACKDAYLDLVKGNIEDTQAGKILKAVLAHAEKEIENGK